MKIKIKTIPIIIAAFGSILITYGFYAFGAQKGTEFHIASTSVAFLFSLITLIASIGIRYETERITIINRIVSSLFLIVGIVALIIINVATINIHTLIITMGVMTLLFVLIVYFVSKSGQ